MNVIRHIEHQWDFHVGRCSTCGIGYNEQPSTFERDKEPRGGYCVRHFGQHTEQDNCENFAEYP